MNCIDIIAPANLEMVAQSRDRETDHGQSRDGPNRENVHNIIIIIIQKESSLVPTGGGEVRVCEVVKCEVRCEVSKRGAG